MRWILLIIPIWVLSCESAVIVTTDEALQKGRELSRILDGREIDALYSHFLEVEYSKQQLTNFLSRLDNTVGHEKKFLNDRIIRGYATESFYKYTRYSVYESSTEPVHTIFGFRENGQLYEFTVETLPKAYPSQHMEYETKTNLMLPFEGLWTVVWGGRTYNTNNHAGSKDQRFAFDFTIMNDHSMSEGDGSENKQYYAYSKPILASGRGVIVKVQNREPENKIGEMTETPGNYVVIDHENGEYSFLCHLQRGSVNVVEGEFVKAGQRIAKCGNSGHSTAPGLHYHLQNTPIIFDGEGLPSQFQNYIANGNRVIRGEPNWNEVVKN